MAYPDGSVFDFPVMNGVAGSDPPYHIRGSGGSVFDFRVMNGVAGF
ncbi:hypothetical protein [Limnospira fusiformis]|nr:hypothetical protein HFV01_03540 [Limnospira fusiformis SAG 85.79]